MEKIIFLLLLSTCISTTAINAAEVSFTQEDRDRLIRLETKQDEGFKATNQRIDDLRDLVYIVIGGMLGLIGFVLWDRRSALATATLCFCPPEIWSGYLSFCSTIPTASIRDITLFSLSPAAVS